jgi:predicted secreted Zn-dependent protease
MRLVFLILIALAVVASAAAARGPKVQTKYEYYEVGGESAEDVRHMMNRRGVRWKDGKTYDAVTRWHVRWTYRYERTDGRCRVSEVTTYVDVVIRLPLWNAGDDISPALRNRWDAYFSALHRHELGHRRFGIDAAEEIEEAISRLDPQLDCADLEAVANELGKRILERYRREEIAYDRNTRHGYTQGAVFP